MDDAKIIQVTNDNIDAIGVYCIKNKKAPGYQKKVDWYKSKFNDGLVIKIAEDEDGKQLGFIEYTPSEQAWRPIEADNYYFIQCIGVFGKQARNQQLGTKLIKACKADAMNHGKAGICTMTSDGPWIATKALFEKNGFSVADQKGRFELLYTSFKKDASTPKFHDWTKEQSTYIGWHLIYADQCPWHEKSIRALKSKAAEHGIPLQITQLMSPKAAQKAPSGYGTFTLIKDGKVLADHYISKTRFENILGKEK